MHVKLIQEYLSCMVQANGLQRNQSDLFEIDSIFFKFKPTIAIQPPDRPREPHTL